MNKKNEPISLNGQGCWSVASNIPITNANEAIPSASSSRKIMTL